MNKTLNVLCCKITELTNTMNEDMTKAAIDKNKSAARRARKASLELTKLLKEFRKLSMDI